MNDDEVQERCRGISDARLRRELRRRGLTDEYIIDWMRLTFGAKVARNSDREIVDHYDDWLDRMLEKDEEAARDAEE